MFISKKRHEQDYSDIADEIRYLKEVYWALYNKHDRLMEHLGLSEHEVNRIEIRTKGGPERGEES